MCSRRLHVAVDGGGGFDGCLMDDGWVAMLLCVIVAHVAFTTPRKISRAIIFGLLLSSS